MAEDQPTPTPGGAKSAATGVVPDTLEQICRLGDTWGLPVSIEQVKAHISTLDDAGSKQWLLKARGGL